MLPHMGTDPHGGQQIVAGKQERFPGLSEPQMIEQMAGLRESLPGSPEPARVSTAEPRTVAIEHEHSMQISSSSVQDQLSVSDVTHNTNMPKDFVRTESLQYIYIGRER